MNRIIEQMLKSYKPASHEDMKNAMKEVIQEIALCGLSRSGFFNKAVFYGGTALRVFYGLDRFSEDLDFSLTAPDPEFRLQPCLPALEREVQSFGLNVTIREKVKAADSTILSPFMKGNTREHLLMFYPDSVPLLGIAATESIKIKLEVDIDPPRFAIFEHRYRLMPLPYDIALYDMPSLFASKIHAVLCRGWKSRVKGRDLYDYVFYLSRNAVFNLEHLQERLVQSGSLSGEQPLTDDGVRDMLCERFAAIDYGQARKDVLPFIRNPSMLDMWSESFFSGITQNLAKTSGNMKHNPS